jgi:predicted HicB family RNase H-like nuclease
MNRMGKGKNFVRKQLKTLETCSKSLKRRMKGISLIHFRIREGRAMKKKATAHTSVANTLDYLVYKYYFGTIRVDLEKQMLFGHVIGTSDKIIYEGKTVKELEDCFHKSVEEYLEFCNELGKTPEKSFSGNILFRSSPELHGKIALAAQRCGKSINSWLNDLVDGAFKHESTAC